jgi:hypothetical protein
MATGFSVSTCLPRLNASRARVGKELGGVGGPARHAELGGGLLGDVGAHVADGGGAGGGELGERTEVILGDDAAADDSDVQHGKKLTAKGRESETPRPRPFGIWNTEATEEARRTQSESL